MPKARAQGWHPRSLATAADDQQYYEPQLSIVQKRIASHSEATIARIGVPERVAYGDAEIEQMDIDSSISIDHSRRTLLARS